MVKLTPFCNRFWRNPGPGFCTLGYFAFNFASSSRSIFFASVYIPMIRSMSTREWQGHYKKNKYNVLFTLTLSSSVDPESLILIFSTKSVTNEASIVNNLSNQIMIGLMIGSRTYLCDPRLFEWCYKNQEMRAKRQWKNEWERERARKRWCSW